MFTNLLFKKCECNHVYQKLITYDIKSVFNGDPFVVNYGLKDRFLN